MLYGDNPFFALSLPEILNNIRKYNGSNLPFQEAKNRVSPLSKDLLMKLLEMEPERRIDWEAFFNHPVFAEKHIYEGPNSNIEREFEMNKQSVFMNRENTFIDPISIERKSALPIADTPSNYQRGAVDVDLFIKENQFRYLHEKNKVMLIFLTVKKLRKLMKDPDYNELYKYLYLLVMILAKKGIMLSELTLYSLNMKYNIFKLNQFEQFCSGTREWQEVVGAMQADQRTIFAYNNLLTSVKEEVQLHPDDENILAWLKNRQIDLSQLDEKALILYNQIQDSAKPAKLLYNPEENRRFQLAMFLVLHSIFSEKHLPYVSGGRKFEWETFKMKCESMTPDMLRTGIAILRV